MAVDHLLVNEAGDKLIIKDDKLVTVDLPDDCECCGDAVCPTNCDDCDDSYKVVLSVSNPSTGCFIGAQCSRIDGDTFCFEKHASIDCRWDGVASCASCTEVGDHTLGDTRIECVNDEWVMSLHDQIAPCAVVLVAPIDGSGCPPLTGWVDQDSGACNGSVTVTKFAVC